MLPPRTDGQCCPDCKSAHLLKFGYEWRCESCFHSSRGFFAALHTWAAEFARKDSFWLRLRYPFQNRFARLARVWPGYTEQELRDTFTAVVRIYEEDKYITLGIPAQEIMEDLAERQVKEREHSVKSWEFSHDPKALADWAAELDRRQQKTVKEAAPETPSARHYAEVFQKLHKIFREPHRIELAEVLLRHRDQKLKLDDAIAEARDDRCPPGYERWSDFQRANAKAALDMLDHVRRKLEKKDLL